MRMSVRFFDTNVLLYLAASDDPKAERAERLLADGGVISVQVLNELTNVARRKMGLNWQETLEFLESIRSLLRVEAMTIETHDLGLEIAVRHKLSVYDAMICAAALIGGCGILLSEDMQHGAKIFDALEIVNPFA
jgi:predicted nucleic acid-binding protein